MNYELLKQYIDCAKREMQMRQRVYPRFVASRKMKQETADKEIKLMAGIAATLQKIYDGKAPEEVQQALFDTKEFQKPVGNNNNGFY